MKLSDVVSGAGLAIYAEIALVLFLLAFVGVVLRLYWPGRGGAARDAALAASARLPLDDGTPVPAAVRPTAPHASLATRGR